VPRGRAPGAAAPRARAPSACHARVTGVPASGRAASLVNARARPQLFSHQKEATMNALRSMRNLPYFPVIPFVPLALFVGAFATSIRALVRVRRLERRLAGA
jgi:hypothetical protein